MSAVAFSKAIKSALKMDGDRREANVVQLRNELYKLIIDATILAPGKADTIRAISYDGNHLDPIPPSQDRLLDEVIVAINSRDRVAYEEASLMEKIQKLRILIQDNTLQPGVNPGQQGVVPPQQGGNPMQQGVNQNHPGAN